MKRLMSQKNLDLLITLIDQQDGDEYVELRDYLHQVKRSYNALYSVHRDGAVCLQLHRSTFESTRYLPIGESHDQ